MNIFTLIGILQVIALIHAFRSNRDWYWYALIFFLPLAGPLAYFVYFFMTKQNIEKVENTIKGSINKNYGIEELLHESKYSDTIANRILLADKYAAGQQYLQAITIYESCLTGFNKGDLSTSEKLMVARYFVDDYDEVIKLGATLEKDPMFRHSESRITYALSLDITGDPAAAEDVFRDMDIRFGNYVHRTEYAKFLIANDRTGEAKELLVNLLDELSSMSRTERASKKLIEKEVSTIYKRLSS